MRREGTRARTLTPAQEERLRANKQADEAKRLANEHAAEAKKRQRTRRLRTAPCSKHGSRTYRVTAVTRNCGPPAGLCWQPYCNATPKPGGHVHN